MEFQGILKTKGETVIVSEKFSKRSFVVSTESEQYKQHVLFELTQTRCDLIDPINIGDEVTVKFNLKGREWKSPQGETKYFNTLDAWAIIKTKDVAPQNVNDTLVPTPDDDLPF